jgi:hypothetical protein
MKAVRTQEEKLDEIKHRRKGVASKADSAERKLSKMDPQNKNTPTQSELLTRLRDEMRELDSQIMTEEARLCDLKRTATKSWMTLKFGGLQECCRKGLVRVDRIYAAFYSIATIDNCRNGQTHYDRAFSAGDSSWHTSPAIHRSSSH